MKQAKIAVIGAGRVGTTTAYALILKNLAAKILLVDIDSERRRGEVEDLADSLTFSAASGISEATTQEAGQADIIVITAGVAQQPGETRIELLKTNKKIISTILQDMLPINPHAKIIMVTNPVDSMTLCAQEKSKLPRNQIFGTGTFLDSTRLQLAIAQKIGVAEESVHAYVLGEHGETQFPAWSAAYVSGIPVQKFSEITPTELTQIAEQTKNKAQEIIRRKGATFFGIASCITALCESILFDQKKVFALSCYNRAFNVCLSVPVVLGENGVERILPIHLDKKEEALFAASAMALQHACKS